MNLFRTQHDVTECVTTAVNTILQVAEPEITSLVTYQHPSYETASQVSDNSPLAPLPQAVSPPSSWSDVFSRDPLFYLRLSLSLDLALSRGKAPHVADLPVWAMGPSFMGFQAPSIPLSINLRSPWMPQMALPDPDQHRFVEIGEDSEGPAIHDCKMPRAYLR